LTSFGVFTQGDLLSRVVIERMLAGVATRGFERVADPIGETRRTQASSTSTSAVSRREQLLGRDLSELRPVVLMSDGVEFGGAMCVMALIVTATGEKDPGRAAWR